MFWYLLVCLFTRLFFLLFFAYAISLFGKPLFVLYVMFGSASSDIFNRFSMHFSAIGFGVWRELGK